MGIGSEEILLIKNDPLRGRKCQECACVVIKGSLLFQLQAFQHGEFRVDDFSLAAAIALVQVGAALRAEAFALRSAEGFHRHGHQHLLLHGVAQVDFLAMKKNQADLLGAELNLYWAEFQIPVWRMAARGWKLWDALTERLAADGVLEEYDVVFLDTPPALGYLTINGLAAADILLVPLGASFLEFDSTGRFFDMLHSTFGSIEEAENMAARALGRDGLAFQWDAVRAVITRYNGTQQALFQGSIQYLSHSNNS